MKNKEESNNYEERYFGMNIKVEESVLKDADQMAFMYDTAKKQLLDFIKSEGYKVISGPKLIPLDNEDEFKVEARAEAKVNGENS